MDAMEFIRERNRMCDYYAKNGSCAGVLIAKCVMRCVTVSEL